LRDAGVSEAQLAQLRGPVGLDLGGRQPAETALAILAEIVAERYGGSGRPMREKAAVSAESTRVALEGTPVTAG
jgi:xanthine dehydrogenase accessory factor